MSDPHTAAFKMLVISTLIHWALKLMPPKTPGRVKLAEASIEFHNKLVIK